MDRYYKKWFFPLALPSMILFVVVILVPFLLGALYSFTSWRGTYFSGGGLWESFVGLQNYQAAFQNQKFLDAFWYTIKFTVIAVITINVTALALALMVTKISRLSGIFRTIFFLPNMLGGLALGFIWQFIFQIVFSQILFGPESLLPIPFLQNMTQDNTKALFALAILVTWQMAGYMMIIYITGLNNIPYDLYEAAEIDGASTFQRFRVITLPMLSRPSKSCHKQRSTAQNRPPKFTFGGRLFLVFISSLQRRRRSAWRPVRYPNPSAPPSAFRRPPLRELERYQCPGAPPYCRNSY